MEKSFRQLKYTADEKIFYCFADHRGGRRYTQPLFTYGNKSVDKEEFLRAYNKNKTPVDDKEKIAPRIPRTLHQIQTEGERGPGPEAGHTPQLQYDAQSFRTQIEDSYLNNEATVNNLYGSLYPQPERSSVLHFFAGVAPTATPDDSLKAFRAISAAQSQLATGRTDYEN